MCHTTKNFLCISFDSFKQQWEKSEDNEGFFTFSSPNTGKVLTAGKNGKFEYKCKHSPSIK